MRPESVACATCGVPSLVVVNGRGGCRDHLDDAFAHVDAVLIAVRELAAHNGRPATVHLAVEAGA